MISEEKTFPSTAGTCEIHTKIWYPVQESYNEPVGVIQIAHGMIDHIERFEKMAEYFADKGFVVAGNDHIGHGDSVKSKDDWGYFGEGKNSGMIVVEDMHRLTRILKKKYPGIPFVIIGHSMGSFMTRKYLMLYGEEVDAAVILGTGNQPGIVVAGGKISANIAAALHGQRYRSHLLSKMMFGSYNKKISNPESPNSWLTRDCRIVEDYDNDEKCTYLFTTNGYIGFLNIISDVIKDKNIKKTPQNLPVLFASGMEDPVGEYGKAVARIYKKYSKYLKDVELKLYEECRHELHSEINRQDIFDDIYDWIIKRI